MIEAQAAGRPSVITDTIPPEATIVPELITRIALAQPAAEWAAAILAVAKTPRAVSPQAALAAIEVSPFDIRRSVAELEAVYARAAMTNDE